VLVGNQRGGAGLAAVDAQEESHRNWDCNRSPDWTS
jgi:hypothetical protein